MFHQLLLCFCCWHGNSLLYWIHPSPCLHCGVYHHLENWSEVFTVFKGKFSLILTLKNPHLAVPGLDIAFVISPSFALVTWSIIWVKEWRRSWKKTLKKWRNWLCNQEDHVILLNSWVLVTVKRQKFLTWKIFLWWGFQLSTPTVCVATDKISFPCQKEEAFHSKTLWDRWETVRVLNLTVRSRQLSLCGFLKSYSEIKVVFTVWLPHG